MKSSPRNIFSDDTSFTKYLVTINEVNFNSFFSPVDYRNSKCYNQMLLRKCSMYHNISYSKCVIFKIDIEFDFFFNLVLSRYKLY